MNEELRQASLANYDPDGSPLIYLTENPFVRNADTILPGVDLSATSRTGIGTLVAPDVMISAFHARDNNRFNIGIINFVDSDNVNHERRVVDFSDQIGDDLILVRFDEPLPASVIPWRIGIFTEEMGSLFGHRRVRTEPDRISTGNVRILPGRTLFDLDRSAEFPQHYVGPMIGDSGGGIFIVLNGEPLLLGPTFNAGEQGTAGGLHVEEILAYEPSIEFFDLSTFEPPAPPPEINIDVVPMVENTTIQLPGNGGNPIDSQSDDLKRICESIRTIEDLLDSGATSVTQDGQTVVFDRKDARKRLRQLQQRKLDLEAAASGTGRRAKRRRPLLNRIDLRGY